LDYLAVGLPLGKIGVGFGLIPYSSVGYQIQTCLLLMLVLIVGQRKSFLKLYITTKI
jgi:hypothetical protein